MCSCPTFTQLNQCFSISVGLWLGEKVVERLLDSNLPPVSRRWTLYLFSWADGVRGATITRLQLSRPLICVLRDRSTVVSQSTRQWKHTHVTCKLQTGKPRSFLKLRCENGFCCTLHSFHFDRQFIGSNIQACMVGWWRMVGWWCRPVNPKSNDWRNPGRPLQFIWNVSYESSSSSTFHCLHFNPGLSFW